MERDIEESGYREFNAEGRRGGGKRGALFQRQFDFGRSGFCRFTEQAADIGPREAEGSGETGA